MKKKTRRLLFGTLTLTGIGALIIGAFRHIDPFSSATDQREQQQAQSPDLPLTIQEQIKREQDTMRRFYEAQGYSDSFIEAEMERIELQIWQENLHQETTPTFERDNLFDRYRDNEFEPGQPRDWDNPLRNNFPPALPQSGSIGLHPAWLRATENNAQDITHRVVPMMNIKYL